MPYQPETSYFVQLDTPPPISRHVPLSREGAWNEPTPLPQTRRRRRRSQIRPLVLVLCIPLAWLLWAYTTPGGPSARIDEWISQVRGDVAEVSASPSLRQTANYFNDLYAAQGSYPYMSDTAIQADPKAAFGISMTFTWCSPRDVVIGSPNAGGTVSRLLLDGKDLGNVPGVQGCPNLARPAPWKASQAR